MKSLLVFVILAALTTLLYAKEYAWCCAVEYSKEHPEWVFVYEDVKLQQDGTYRVYVKWDFPNDTAKSHAKQTWVISPDFDRMCVIESAGYDGEGKNTYFQKYPYGRDWSYVMPDTYAESIVITAKQILFKDE